MSNDMEWAIPIQNFDPKQLRVGVPGKGAKPIVPLSYVEGDASFVTFTLLLPILTVRSWDSGTGKLVLSLTGHTGVAAKLQALQDSLLLTVSQQQRVWFAGERAKDMSEIRDGFQPLVEGSGLHLYCPVSGAAAAATPNEIQVYSKGAWGRGVSAGTFSTGGHVRVALRLQGLSFHQHPVSGMWTGKFRIQHRILAVLVAN